MNEGIEDWNEHLFKQEVKKNVEHAIKYLLSEGVIVKEQKKYRIKTKKEIEQELRDIANY